MKILLIPNKAPLKNLNF